MAKGVVEGCEKVSLQQAWIHFLPFYPLPKDFWLIPEPILHTEVAVCFCLHAREAGRLLVPSVLPYHFSSAGRNQTHKACLAFDLVHL